MNINVEYNTKLSGQYRLEVKRADGTVEDTGWMNNLVLNNGLNLLGNHLAPLYYCQVGTGTSTPIASQTSLDAQVASQFGNIDSTVNNGSPTYSTTCTTKYVFPQGAVVGNIAEIGVSNATSGNLFSRSRIKTISGSPTTITITSLDQLTVYYALTLVPTLTDRTGSVTLAGTPYAYTTRLLDVTSFATNSYNLYNGYWMEPQSLQTYDSDAALVPYTSYPMTGTPTSGPSGNWVYGTYVNGNYYIDSTYTFAPSDSINVGGIGGLATNLYGGINYQTVFSPPIPKTNTQTLILNFRYSWSA